MSVTLAYAPMTLPLMSRFAVAGSVKLAIPVSWEPLPMKKGATTLPRTLTCPLAAMLPPTRSTLPTFPEAAKISMVELYVISFVVVLYTSTGLDAATLLMGAIVNVPAAGDSRAPPVALMTMEFACWLVRPANAPIATADAPWEVWPALDPSATDRLPCLVDPAHDPTATEDCP